MNNSDAKARVLDIIDTFSKEKQGMYSRAWQQNFVKIGYNFTNSLTHSTISLPR